METEQRSKYPILSRVTLATSVLVLLLVFVSSTAMASTLKVGPSATYTTIQDAVDAAIPGDDIKVAPGTYDETVDITCKEITVEGSKLPTVQGFSISGSSVTIKGFNINEYGVIVYSPYANIMNNVIANANYGVNVRSGLDIPEVSKNSFKNCDTAIYLDGYYTNPGRIYSFKNNRYINCRVNIGGPWLS